MFGRRRRARTRRRVAPEMVGFARTIEHVEAGKAALVSAAPRGRPSAVPLAEALAGFERRLAEAVAVMPSWRSSRTARQWDACMDALRAATAGAERLRLEGEPRGYEDLVEELDALLTTLEAFERALGALEEMG